MRPTLSHAAVGLLVFYASHTQCLRLFLYLFLFMRVTAVCAAFCLSFRVHACDWCLCQVAPDPATNSRSLRRLLKGNIAQLVELEWYALPCYRHMIHCHITGDNNRL
jgi:hypothetical protein